MSELQSFPYKSNSCHVDTSLERLLGSLVHASRLLGVPVLQLACMSTNGCSQLEAQLLRSLGKAVALRCGTAPAELRCGGLGTLTAARARTNLTDVRDEVRKSLEHLYHQQHGVHSTFTMSSRYNADENLKQYLMRPRGAVDPPSEWLVIQMRKHCGGCCNGFQAATFKTRVHSVTTTQVHQAGGPFKALVAKVRESWAPCMQNRFADACAITSCLRPVFSSRLSWAGCSAQGVPPLFALEVDGSAASMPLDVTEVEVLRMPGFVVHFELISIGYHDGGHYVCDNNLASGKVTSEWVRFDGLMGNGLGQRLAAAPDGQEFNWGNRPLSQPLFRVASAVYGRVSLEAVALHHGLLLPAAHLPAKLWTFSWSDALVAELPSPLDAAASAAAAATVHTRAHDDDAILAQQPYVDGHGRRHLVDFAHLRCGWYEPSTSEVVRHSMIEGTVVCTSQASGPAVLYTLARTSSAVTLLCLCREGDAWQPELSEALPLLCKQYDSTVLHSAGKVAALRARTMLWREAPTGELAAPLEVSVVIASMPRWGDVRTAAWHAALHGALHAGLESAVDEGARTLIVGSLAPTGDKLSVDSLLSLLQSRMFAGSFDRVVVCENSEWEAYDRVAVRGWLCNVPACGDSALAAVVEQNLREQCGWTDVAGHTVKWRVLNDMLVRSGQLSVHELALAAGWLLAEGRWHPDSRGAGVVRIGTAATPTTKAVRYNMRLVRSDGGPLPPVLLRTRHAVGAAPLRVSVRVNAGGLTSVGCELQAADPALRIGTMVAGNSGRPGGACGCLEQTPGGRGLRVIASKLHCHHKTQEEDVVSNWLLTHAFNSLIVGDADTAAHCSNVFRTSLHEPKAAWGLKEPRGTSCDTIQGVDYTTASDPALYADAWIVDRVRLSRKDPAGPVLVRADQYSTSLFFVAGPNANVPDAQQQLSSSTLRTFNRYAAADYQFFRAGVAAALRTALLAMAARGFDVALIAGVSTGLYSGLHRQRINDDFEGLVNDLLDEPMIDGGRAGRPACLGDCFKHVIWTILT